MYVCIAYIHTYTYVYPLLYKIYTGTMINSYSDKLLDLCFHNNPVKYCYEDEQI